MYGYSAKRLVSAASLGLVVALATTAILPGWVENPGTPAITLLSAASFSVGLFFYRAAAIISASVTLSHTALRLAGLPVNLGYLAALSLVAASAMWPISRRREYVPYSILGCSAFAYFTSYLVDGVLAVLLAVSVALVSYAVQERAWWVRSRYERLRLSLARYRRSAPGRIGRPRRLRRKPVAL